MLRLTDLQIEILETSLSDTNGLIHIKKICKDYFGKTTLETEEIIVNEIMNLQKMGLIDFYAKNPDGYKWIWIPCVDPLVASGGLELQKDLVKKIKEKKDKKIFKVS